MRRRIQVNNSNNCLGMIQYDSDSDETEVKDDAEEQEEKPNFSANGTNLQEVLSTK